MTPAATLPADLRSLWPQDEAALSRFDHPAHVRVAREYLLALPLPAAVGAFARDLEAMTRRFGAGAKFHRTITLAWMLVIADRVLRRPGAPTWEEFAAANTDLLSRDRSPFRDLFHPDTLGSEEARRQYLLPDRPENPPLRLFE